MKNKSYGPFWVYITINKLTGMQYVGMSAFRNPNYIGSGKLLYKDIKKYNKSNFSCKRLMEFSTRKNAHVYEELCIEMYNTLTPNGYNIDKYGGSPGVDHTIETKLKISIAISGDNCSAERRKKMSTLHIGNKYWVGKKHTDKTKKKISEANIGNTKMLGKTHTDKTKMKIRESLMGNIPINKGLPMTDEQKEKIRDTKSKRTPKQKKIQINKYIATMKAKRKAKAKLNKNSGDI